MKTFVLIAGIGFWIVSQAVFSRVRKNPPSEIWDLGHLLTSGLHRWITHHPTARSVLQISSSVWIDVTGIALIVWAYGSPDLRATASLLTLVALRQGANALQALPLPHSMDWNSPGFPSLFVKYGPSSNLFFSGHTAFAVLAALEAHQAGARELALFSAAGAIYQALLMLVLRAHWSLDIFTGVLAALVSFWMWTP